MPSPDALKLLQEIKKQYLDNPDLKMEVSLSPNGSKADFRFVPKEDTDRADIDKPGGD